MKGFPQIERVKKVLPNPTEKHTADSKWQFCNCESCQEIRMRIDSMPGVKFDYSTYRHRDEKY